MTRYRSSVLGVLGPHAMNRGETAGPVDMRYGHDAFTRGPMYNGQGKNGGKQQRHWEYSDKETCLPEDTYGDSVVRETVCQQYDGTSENEPEE